MLFSGTSHGDITLVFFPERAAEFSSSHTVFLLLEAEKQGSTSFTKVTVQPDQKYEPSLDTWFVISWGPLGNFSHQWPYEKHENWEEFEQFEWFFCVSVKGAGDYSAAAQLHHLDTRHLWFCWKAGFEHICICVAAWKSLQQTWFAVFSVKLLHLRTYRSNSATLWPGGEEVDSKSTEYCP